MSETELDVAVVGAGVVGLATADALARRGSDVRCFEVATPGHAQSGGLTRIFRHRHDDERLVALAVQARRAWQQWEQRCGRRLLGAEGAVFAGATDGDGERLTRHGVSHRFVDPARLGEVFGLAAPTTGRVLVDEPAGASRARRAIRALQAWVGERIERVEVLGVTHTTRGVQVQTGQGAVSARHAILCAGAATPRLAAGAGLALPVEQSLQARPSFRIRAGYAAAPAPCWVDTTGEHGERVYGSPVGTTGRYAVGLSGDTDGVVLPEDGRVPAGTDVTEQVDRITGYVRRALPGLEPVPESVKLCISTMLSTGHDAFGAWQAGAITAFAGQNLFKHAPVLGEMLADVATTGEVADLLRPTVPA